MAEPLPFGRRRGACAKTETEECDGCERVFAVNDLHYDVEDASPLCDECYEECPVVEEDDDGWDDDEGWE